MTLFVSEALPKVIEDMLFHATACGRGNSRVIRLPAFDRYDAPVASHPDMLLFYHSGKIFCPEAYYAVNHELLERGIKSTEGGQICIKDNKPVFISFVPVKTPEPYAGGKCRYPDDVALNAAQLISPSRGDMLFCRRKSTAVEIVSLYSDDAIADVRQGYAHCSVCTVTERAIITSDDGIARRAGICGIDVLKISPGGIKLDGYDSGFIGGASARVGDALCFFGDPKTHQDGGKIIKFVNDHMSDCTDEENNLRRMVTCPGTLRDYGSALYIP